jgi:acetylornithine deacetylase/succinyl-diaminopimelate desuccinylase-like protein
MESIKKYVEENHQTFLDELFDLLSIPSVSAKSENKPDCRKAAEFLVNQLSELGFDTILEETPGNPIIVAHYPIDESKPTVLIYGHYDVQPEEPLELWESEPFQPEIREENIYARGATDDKGQLFAHIKAVESIIRTEGELPINVTFLLEGEEEIASVNLTDYIKKNKDKLECDVVVISDSSQFGPDMPAITYGLRGISAVEIRIDGAKQDLHSGSYGGAVPNPCFVLCEIIAKLKDENGKITIPGFYDDVLDLEDWEREECKKLPHNDEQYRKNLDVAGLDGEKGFSTLERIWARPTLEINGIFGGYSGEGDKTIIPSWAGAKITMRLVPNQEPKKIAALFQNYIQKIAPDYVRLTVEVHSGGFPVITPRDTKFMQQAVEAVKYGFGKEPLFIREGGSIPVVALMSQELKADTLLLGFGLPDDNAHAPNEKFSENDFQRGILTSAYFIQNL